MLNRLQSTVCVPSSKACSRCELTSFSSPSHLRPPRPSPSLPPFIFPCLSSLIRIQRLAAADDSKLTRKVTPSMSPYVQLDNLVMSIIQVDHPTLCQPQISSLELNFGIEQVDDQSSNSARRRRRLQVSHSIQQQRLSSLSCCGCLLNLIGQMAAWSPEIWKQIQVSDDQLSKVTPRRELRPIYRNLILSAGPTRQLLPWPHGLVTAVRACDEAT